MISKDMITKGYDRGVVKLEKSPNNDGIVCRIGDDWFYFGGLTAEEYEDVEKFKTDIPRTTIVEEIFEVLNDFRFQSEEFIDEYKYYEAVLRESKCDQPESQEN